MILRMRSMLTWASLALPFHRRQRSRSASATITAFASCRAGVSVDKEPAVCSRCCSRIAIWNQSRIGSAVTPVAARIDRRPAHPSVKPVNTVVPVRPTLSSVRPIRATRSVSDPATAANTCRPPASVSALPTLTSRCRPPSSRLRMNVESTLMEIAAEGVAGAITGRCRSCSPSAGVWRRRVS